MCDCSSNPCGCNSGIELPYMTGPAGSNGIFGGFSAEWKFDASSTIASPAANYIRFNNATLASVTQIHINESNIDSIDHSNFLTSFVNDNNFGHIRIFKEHNSNIFWLGTITGVTEIGSVRTFNVTYILSNGTFTSEDNIVVTFTPIGADGAAGTNGTNGTDGVGAYVVDAVFTGSVNAGAVADSELAVINIPADTLSTNKDMLEFSASITRTNVNSPLVEDLLFMSFGDQGYVSDSNERALYMKCKGSSIRINGRVIRNSSTSCIVDTEIIESFPPTTDDGIKETINSGITKKYFSSGMDFASINNLEIIIPSGNTEGFTLHNFIVKYTKKSS